MAQGVAVLSKEMTAQASTATQLRDTLIKAGLVLDIEGTYHA